MGSERRQRNATQIMVRVTHDEKNIIRKKAEAFGLKPPTYLRNLGLNHEMPKGILDQKAVLDLLKVHADLDRLSYFLKSCLTSKEKSAEVKKSDVSSLYQKIEKAMDRLKEKILSI